MIISYTDAPAVNFGIHKNSPPSRILMASQAHLPRTPAGEDKPTVEYGGATFAPATGLDPYCGCGAFNDVTETYSLVLVNNEAGKAHLVRLASSLYHVAIRCRFFAQPTHLLARTVAIDW